MGEKLSESPIVARAPQRLAEALQLEAQRRMVSMSAIIRLAVMKELGLYPTATPSGDQAQEVTAK